MEDLRFLKKLPNENIRSLITKKDITNIALESEMINIKKSKQEKFFIYGPGSNDDEFIYHKERKLILFKPSHFCVSIQRKCTLVSFKCSFQISRG